MDVIRAINGEKPRIQPLVGSYTVTRSDLLSDGSGRSAETGSAIRYLVRKDTYKLGLKFKGTVEDVASVYELLNGFELLVEFFDGYQPNDEMKYTTRKMYPGDRQFLPGEHTAELSVNLIEI